MCAVGAATAFAACEAPQFEPELLEERVYSTRAHIEAAVLITNAPSAPEVEWGGEYAPAEGGGGPPPPPKKPGEPPWTPAGGGTVANNEIAVELGAKDATDATILHHLSPKTIYYARFHVKVKCSSTEELSAEEQFKVEETKAVAAPEIPKHSTGPTTFRVGATSPTTAVGEAQVESNGAETLYEFEYALSENGKSGPWEAFSSGEGSAEHEGVVTVAADFADPEAKLIGLKPETTYFVRLKASNKEGVTIQDTYEGRGGAELESFTTPTAKPVAFEPSVSAVTGTSVHLSGSLSPHGSETEWRFEYTSEPEKSASWVVGPGGVVSQKEAEELPEGVGPPGIEGTLSGLSAGTVYYVRLFAENKAGGEGVNGLGEPILGERQQIRSFETAGPPSASASATHGIHGESLRLLGTVGPHGYDTHYYFEYVTQTQFEHSGFREALRTPEMDAGGGGEESNGHFTLKFVGADLPGLQAGETYHYRLVATNSSPGDPVIDSTEQSLAVPAVSPPGPEEVCLNQALRTGPSANLPDCRAYEMLTPVDKEGSQEIFAYDTLKSPAYELVGEDGEHLMLEAPVVWGSTAGSGQAPYFFSRTPTGWQVAAATVQPQAGVNTYAPQVFSDDLTQFAFESGFSTSGGSGQSKSVEYKMSVPGAPYVNVATVPRSMVGYSGGWVAASLDFSKLIVQSEDRALVEPRSTTKSGNDLYEYSQGKLRQVNVGIGTCGANIARGNEGAGGSSSPHAVSVDGSRVFFEAVPGSECSASKHLYVRVNGVETLDLGVYRFAGATSDGSEVLLEKPSGENFGLYLYQDKTAKLLSSSGSIAGTNFTVSEDLKTIYFTSGAASETDIYRYDIASETLGFVVQSNATTYEPESYLSPDGRYYYFTSRGVAGLPGGATVPGGGQEQHPTPLSSLPPVPTEQVYRYDSVEHVVECVSCASAFDPEPRLGANFGKADNAQGTATDGVPRRSMVSANGDFVFFQTPAALVPADVDGEVTPEGDLGANSAQPEHASADNSVSGDVYEWRRDGVDGCGVLQGCLALITNGRGGLLNILLGSAEDGRDVFIYTHSQLVGQDNDTAGDIYDARVGGGFPPGPPDPVECEGDACSTPASPPNDATPSSFTFSGNGNIVQAVPLRPAVKSKNKSEPKKKKKKKSSGKKKEKAGKRRGKKAGNGRGSVR